MKDPRIQKLAQTLVHYSCSVQPGERILVEDRGLAPELDAAIIEEVYKAGGIPQVLITDLTVERALLMGCTQEQLEWMARHDAARMAECAAYIGIRGGHNAFEQSDVPEEKKRLYSKHYSKPVHMEVRVPKTRWVVLRYPTSAMAQQAGMSTAAFEDFFFTVCTMDYRAMSRAMDALVARMQRTDRVHLVGPGTDLTFSIKGQPAIKCDGKLNIPDGEVFTAPVRDSINGVITFNTPSLYQGVTHENIRLVFRDGRIVEESGSRPDLLTSILNTDEGARGVGEFAIGVNPYILHPMKDTLFDEKIAGSFHFTPGNCYDDCPNGNHSAIHWDLVNIQRPEYGGGQMWFDEELVRSDGLFVPEELHCLNPDYLKEEA